MRQSTTTICGLAAVGVIGIVQHLTEQPAVPAVENALLEGMSAPEAATPATYFANCREAWAAGAAPIRSGEPGYRKGMDGDSDGIACEPHY